VRWCGVVFFLCDFGWPLDGVRHGHGHGQLPPLPRSSIVFNPSYIVIRVSGSSEGETANFVGDPMQKNTLPSFHFGLEEKTMMDDDAVISHKKSHAIITSRREQQRIYALPKGIVIT
jgi:hypothetical protein